MKKTFKQLITIISIFNIGGISLSLSSCGRHKDSVSFNTFMKSANHDAQTIITSDRYKSFGVSDYWGSAILDPIKINQRISGIFEPASQKLKADTAGSFEEMFNYDTHNTIALVMFKGKKGDLRTQVYKSSKVIFNSWNNRKYLADNWNDFDNGPSYIISKFFNAIKTNQTKLVKIFGSNKIANSLRYQGVSKFSISQISGHSYLSIKKQIPRIIMNLRDDTAPLVISTDYTFIITGIDSNTHQNIVNITLHFSTNILHPPILSIDNMTAASFNNTTIISAMSLVDLKAEFNTFLAMKNVSDPTHTFKELWMNNFKILPFTPGSSVKTLILSALNVDSIDKNGTIKLTIKGHIKSNSSVNVYKIKTNPLITDGFHSIKNPQSDSTSYVRFSKTNYGFSDPQVWGKDSLATTMFNIFRLTYSG